MEKDDYILKVSNLSVEISNKPIITNVTFKISRGITLAIVGLISAVSSILSSNYFNVVSSPLVVIAGIILFLVAIIIK